MGVVIFKIPNFSESTFQKGAISFFVASVANGLSSILLHLIVSRYLGPSQYSLVSSFLNLLTLISVPFAAIQVSVADALIKSNHGISDFSLRKTLNKYFVISLVGSFVALICLPELNSFLHSNSVVPGLLLILWIPLAMISAVLTGVLMASYRFQVIALTLFFCNGIIRLAVSVIAVKIGFGPSGAITGSLMAQFVGVLVLIIILRSELRNSSDLELNLERIYFPTFVFIGNAIFVSIDTLLARHFLSPSDAGLYSAGVTTAHIVLFVPSTLVMLMFPFLAEGSHVSRRSRLIFYQFLALTLITGSSFLLLSKLFPSQCIKVLYGAGFNSAAEFLDTLVLGSFLFSITLVFTILHLARRSKSALIPWLGVIAAVALIFVTKRNPTDVATMMLKISIFITMLASITGLLQLKNKH